MLKNNTIKKFISIFLTLIIIILSVPFVFAAGPIVLSEDNITSWPFADGEIFFGQRICDGVTLSGGTVKYNGSVVPGHFEFTDVELRPEQGEPIPSIDFIPDSTEYTGFTVVEAWDVFYTVKKTTPVYENETENPVVASKIDAGSKLSSSILSGGKMVNPYYADEPKIAARTWEWENPDMVVSESGFYTAKFIPGGYTKTTAEVYVELNKSVIQSTISEAPSISDFTYSGKMKWSDVVLNGGIAVEEGTTTPVEGTFEVSDLWKNADVKVGTHNVGVKFIPKDTENYLGAECTVTVTVSKATPTFKTEDGSGVPTITMPYGTKLDSSFDYLLKGLVDIESGTNLTFGYNQLNDEELSYSNTTPAVGTHKVQVNVTVHGNENYEKTTPLTFNLVITGFESNCTIVPVANEGFKIVDESIAYNGTKPAGTFTVNCTIDGVAQDPIEVKYDKIFKPETPKTGAYSYTVTYNAVENDPFTVSVKGYNEPITLSHKLTATGAITVDKPCGETVEIVAPATDPALAEKPYYGFVKWEVTKGNIGLEEEQLENGTINFTMPDEEVELKATYEFDFLMFIKFIFDTICNWFKSVFASLGTLF